MKSPLEFTEAESLERKLSFHVVLTFYGLGSVVWVANVGVSTPLHTFASFLGVLLFCFMVFKFLITTFSGSKVPMPEASLDPLPESDDPLDFQVRFPARSRQ